ncbi:hypothetical protein UK23_08565 [Lentzea aerocolonigenes]|uniref:Tachylectin 2 domain-containing protein n=1 Tax=Lentzea aerocolonigenes TaxID=68170 RepID=A0A0F0HBL7_LENAE|nr:hypothetical protein [Lentzea aerocolonigenes]KJK51023.1 hypothetical protein UK23_08565 [Lentzea aerocolonigenes]
MGLRKVLLAFVMLLTVVTPAEAYEPCALWERQVYAVTGDGALVEHTFCLDANRSTGLSRWTGDRVVARSGWDEVTTAFWSGHEHGDGVYYRVVGSGLYWSSDLTSWQQIGRKTDWSAFTSLTSPEPGVIYGTESSGAVRRWEHSGWQDGADTWGAASTTAVLPKGSVLYGHTYAGFIGNSGTVNVWGPDFTRSKLRITVPDGVDRGAIVPFDLEQRYPNSAFALTSNGGKLVLLLPGTCAKLERPWVAGDETGGGYVLLFAGGYQRHGTGPVEWQCGGPNGPVN